MRWQASAGEERVFGKAYDARLLRRLYGFLRPYRFRILLATAILLVASVAQLVGPYLTKIAIDDHIRIGDLAGLWFIVLLYVAALVVQFALQYLQLYITQWVGQRTMHDLRMRIFSHIEHLDLSFFDRKPVGRLVTRTTSDVQSLSELFTSGVVAIFGDVVTLLGIVAAMFYLNWRLALVAMIVVPFLSAATVVFRMKVRESFRKVRAKIAKLNAFLQEHISGMAEIQGFVAEKKAFEKFDVINRSLRNSHLKTVFYFAAFFPVVEILGAVSLALIIWYGGGQIIKGYLTFGALVAFIQYADRFFYPIRDLSEKYNILQQAMASSERIFSLLDTEPKVREPAEPKKLPVVKGHLSFENVYFAYDGDNWVLKNINLEISPGERVAIVGATGAGKTSLISLLLRFYDFREGDIRLDGVSITKLPLKEYRRNFALVLQDVFMFSGDIASNIRLGNRDISDDHIWKALKAVGAEPFLRGLEGGIGFKLEERGGNLSVGQRQLLAFARALAFNPRILILDEATSSVDTQTEMLIQQALERLLKGRTSIVIAHRLSTIRNSDRIVVMHKGMIKEEGTHSELLAEKGIYSRLYRLQYEDEKALTGVERM